MTKTKYLLYALKLNTNHKNTYWYETDNKYFNEKKPPKHILDNINLEIDILEENRVSYVREYQPATLKGKRFDFAILDTNNQIIRLIEFDGEQHFKPVEHLGGEKHYNNTVINDEIKNEFCRKNNILLLRVPFYEINDINDIIEKFLNNIS